MASYSEFRFDVSKIIENIGSVPNLSGTNIHIEHLINRTVQHVKVSCIQNSKFLIQHIYISQLILNIILDFNPTKVEHNQNILLKFKYNLSQVELL